MVLQHISYILLLPCGSAAACVIIRALPFPLVSTVFSYISHLLRGSAAAFGMIRAGQFRDRMKPFFRHFASPMLLHARLRNYPRRPKLLREDIVFICFSYISRLLNPMWLCGSLRNHPSRPIPLQDGCFFIHFALRVCFPVACRNTCHAQVRC